jgi:predicted tellurium resistance membrane protein TerC
LDGDTLYFAFAEMIHRFACPKHTLGLVLMFVGGKIICNQFGGHIEPHQRVAPF